MNPALRHAARAYVAADAALEAAGAELYTRARAAIAAGERPSDIARELGWDRRRFHAWMTVRDKRTAPGDADSGLTGSEATGAVRGESTSSRTAPRERIEPNRTKAMTTTYAYLRVSTAGQAANGYGLDTQREAIAAWAESNRTAVGSRASRKHLRLRWSSPGWTASRVT